jgi:hypothetical protein
MAENASLWLDLCDTGDRKTSVPTVGGKGERVDYGSIISYLPILTGGLFEHAIYFSGMGYSSVSTEHLPQLIDRIGCASLDSEADKSGCTLLRWRSSETALDGGPNFEGSTFLSMLKYHLKKRAVDSPISTRMSIEKSFTSYNPLLAQSEPFRNLKVYVHDAEVELSDEGRLVGTEETMRLMVPRMVIEGTNTSGSIIRKYEYMPTLMCLSFEDIDEFPSKSSAVGGVKIERLYLSLSIQFPFSDAWRVLARIRLALPSSDFSSMNNSVLSVLRMTSPPSNPSSPRSSSTSSSPQLERGSAFLMKNPDIGTLLSSIEGLIDHGIDQYCFDLQYVGSHGTLYQHLEEVLTPVLQTGKNSKSKESSFYQSNHVALAWEYLHPYVEQFDKNTATRMNESFLQGDFFLGALFPSMRTASNASLAEIYEELDEKPWYYGAKLNGEQSKIFIVIEAASIGSSGSVEVAAGEEEYQLSFFEALALEGTMRRWKLEPDMLRSLYQEQMPKGKRVLFVFDAEYIEGIFEVFRALVVANENYMPKTDAESWTAIASPLVSLIFGFLRANNIIVQVNVPTVLTKKNFLDLCMMNESTIGGLPTDGLVLTLTTALYLNLQGEEIVKTRFKLKPADHNTIDLLLKKVSLDMLAPHNIKLPKGAISAYIAYTTGTLGIVLSAPIPKLRSGVWRTKHFPSLMKFEKSAIPCEFMTAILPTSHVAVVTDSSAPDFDDKVAECLLETSNLSEGWIKPLFVREAKTASYKSGAHAYGNGYRVAVSMLPSILDPVTPSSIAAIKESPKKYFDPSLSALKPAYKDFLSGNEVGKAVIYGKYLSTALNPRQEASSRPEKRGPVSKTKWVVTPHTLIELGCGRGDDIPRAYCAGARTIFAIDPDVHALLQYETKAFGLSSRYGNSAYAVQNRRRFMIPLPTIYPASTFNIPQSPVWSLRTLVGKVSDSEEDVDHIWKSLVVDSNFPSTGVAAIAIHFTLQYMVESVTGMVRLQALCDRLLSPLGLVSFMYYDGQMIYDLFKNPSHAWTRIELGERVALEIKHSDPLLLGQRKFYIEKRFDEAKPSGRVGFGRKVAILLPTVSADMVEEYLIDPEQLVGAFVPDYQVVYDGPMMDEPSYFEALKESGLVSISKSLPDCFTPGDYQYLGLIRITILEKVAKRRRGDEKGSSAKSLVSQMFSACSS